MRGRWADGIVPRNLLWVLKDRLAVCERPGGYGPNHRAVRRTEEIIWIRRNEFTAIVSLLAGPHNLHSYDEGEVPYVHMPLGEAPQASELLAVYEELARRMEAGERLLMHHERVDDVLGGFLAGFWIWIGRYSDVPTALHATERLLRRPIGRWGREAAMAVARTGVTRADQRPPADLEPPSNVTGGDVLDITGEMPAASPERPAGDR